MITRKNTIATVALFATVALAGCGDSSDGTPQAQVPAATSVPGVSTPESTPATSAAPVSSSPKVAWAEKLCSAMQGKAIQITPPNMNAGGPEAVQKQLVKFFSSVVDQLSAQETVLDDVGAPPGANAESDWKDAVKDLKDTRSKVSKITAGVKAANPSDAAELQAVVSKLGTQMQAMASYQGPIASLQKSKALGSTIAEVPACVSILPTATG